MIDRLLELIREEKIILFAGAGTSIDAGYPTGFALRDVLFNSLKLSEKELVDQNLPLSNFSEEFCRIKDDNRKTLNRILLSQFRYRKPLQNDWHRELAKISHIKTIITTNFDSLFEDSYQDRGQLFFNSKHLSNKNQKYQTSIFKLHGDLSDLKSIILTTSDYNRFFKEDSESSIFWSAVKTEMATNNILFLGYNLEDSNVNVIFEKILEELGNNNKEHFFISPNIPRHRISHLEKRGISYIDLRAKDFLIALKKNIEENVVEDFHTAKVSEGTFVNYSRNYGLMPLLKPKYDKFEVTDFRGINQPVQKTITIELANGWDLGKEISKYVSSNNFNSFEIPKEKITQSFLKYDNILHSKNRLAKILISPVPEIQAKVDIHLEDGFEYDEIEVKLFKRENFAKVDAKLKCSNVELNFDLSNEDNTDFQFSFDHHKICGRLKDEINDFKLIKAISSGKKISIYSKGYNPLIDSLSENLEFAEMADIYINCFENLKLIENHFEIKFENILFKSLTHEKIQIIEMISASVNNIAITKSWNGEMIIDIKKAEEFFDDAREKILSDQYDCIYPSFEEDVIRLFDQRINLGYRVTKLEQPYISNFNEIVDGLSDKAIFKSKVDRILVGWRKNI